jgi:surface antigen
VYNSTPAGPGPWTVPEDPCNTEGSGGNSVNFYSNCAYWAAEKRPDVWVNAVWKYGYVVAPGGAWNIEVDAAQAGYPIDHTPQAGDLAVWGDNASMGSGWTASPGGHVAYVASVNGDGTITISQMGVNPYLGGYTMNLAYNPQETYFIHQLHG